MFVQIIINDTICPHCQQVNDQELKETETLGKYETRVMANGNLFCLNCKKDYSIMLDGQVETDAVPFQSLPLHELSTNKK